MRTLRDCPEIGFDEDAFRRQAASDEATLAGVVLPALTGSERQVAWAETIRRERLAAAMRVDAETARRFIEQVEAKWWIDHREQQLA